MQYFSVPRSQQWKHFIHTWTLRKHGTIELSCTDFFAGYKKFPDVTSVQEAMNLNYEKKYIQVQKYMYKYSLGTRMGGSQHTVIKQRFSIGCRMFNQIWRQQLRFTSTRTSRVTLCECETCYSWAFTEILTQMFVRTAQPLQKLRLRSGNAKEGKNGPADQNKRCMMWL